jgi:predicted CXXCH cytochrome family protein
LKENSKEKMKMKKTIYVLALLFITSSYYAQNNLNDNTCATEDCHGSIMKKANVHSPMNDGCTTCHEKKNGNHPGGNGAEFGLIESASDLCGTCHDTEATQKVVHMPFYEGNCISCHSPHSSDLPALLNGANQRETCEQCHNVEVAENNFRHGPFMSNQCTSCHVGHQSNYESLVVDGDPGLCFQCHLGKEEDLELANVHPVFQDGCLDCHSPHSSPASNMLLTGGNELCYTCHESIKADVTAAKIVHDPLKNGECVSCHSPHAGELTNLLVNEQPNLCFNCHSVNINNKERYIDIYGRLSKEFVHEPVFENPCTDCHLPHVSKNTKLLSAAFPKGNYTKPKMKNFAMCFECHDSDKITTKVTTTATNFRDGSNNLHSLHVMKKKSISCQSCHDMHGADNKHNIGNVVYFGKWEMPIGYKVTPTGGTCLPGCHVQYEYNRDKN